MDGFVISTLDENNDSLEYWDGQALVKEPGNSKFFSDKVTARYEMGTLQSKYPESEVSLKKATLTITVS
jgi:hypothetical protein